MIHQNLSTLRKLMLLKGATGGSKAIEATATGNPLIFLTDLARPLKSLLIPFTPQQEGTGDPSPQNIRSILPWNGLKVWNSGANVFDGVLENGYINDQGQNEGTGNIRSKNYIPVVPLATYRIVFTPTSGTAYNMKVFYYEKDKTFIRSAWKFGGDSITIPENAYFIRFHVDSAYSSGTDRDIAINYPSTETGYEAPHITETDIVFPSPVYGGTLDVVSGVLTERRYQNVKYKWSEGRGAAVIGNVERRGFIVPSQAKTESELNADITARFCNVAQWKYNYSSDDVHYYGGGYSFYVFLPVGTDENLEIQLVVERTAQPQEIQLTPAQITALIGNNTIWSDADGSMTAVFFKKG